MIKELLEKMFNCVAVFHPNPAVKKNKCYKAGVCFNRVFFVLPNVFLSPRNKKVLIISSVSGKFCCVSSKDEF
jgi:hypothetical protein